MDLMQFQRHLTLRLLFKKETVIISNDDQCCVLITQNDNFQSSILPKSLNNPSTKRCRRCHFENLNVYEPC